MKLLIYTQIWKRPELTELVLKQLAGIKRKGYEISVLAVVSEPEMETLCDKYGVHHVWAENLPLGRKHNIGLQEALKYEWDYCLNVGSDDLLSEKILDLYEPYFQAGEHFFGLNEIWFYDAPTKRICHYKYPTDAGVVAVFGAGRVVSRHMIEHIKGNGRLVFWEDDKDRGLDNSSRKIALNYGYQNKMVSTSEPVIVDVKTDVNIWGFEHYQNGAKKEFEELRDYFPSGILKGLLQLNVKPNNNTIMATVKIYVHKKDAYACYKRRIKDETGKVIREEKVEFKDGADMGSPDENKNQRLVHPGKLVTADVELQKWIETSNGWNKEYYLFKEFEESDDKVDETINLIQTPPAPPKQKKQSPVVVNANSEDVDDDTPPVTGPKKVIDLDGNTVSEAKVKIKEMHPDVASSDISSLANIEKYCIKHNLSIPKLSVNI